MMARHKGKVKIVAGGTDIMNRLRQRLLTLDYVMSLKGVAGLTGHEEKKGRARRSRAGTTLRDIGEAPDVRSLFPAIAESAGLAAAPPIQNMATIGGNLLQDTRCLFYNQSQLVRQAAAPCLKQGGRVCAAVKGGRRCFSVYQGDMAPSLIAFDCQAVVEKGRRNQDRSRRRPLLRHRGQTALYRSRRDTDRYHRPHPQRAPTAPLIKS